MGFIINCLCCHVELEAEEEQVGTSLNCPNCGVLFNVKKPISYVKGKVVNIDYPRICNVVGVIMLIHSSIFIYQAIFDPWTGGASLMNNIKVYIGTIYFLGGIGFLAKQKFGPILGIVSLVLFILGVIIVVGTGELFKSGLIVPILINTVLHVIILTGILSSMKWEKIFTNPPILASCPGCETNFKLKDTQMNKSIKCAKCEEVFTCTT